MTMMMMNTNSEIGTTMNATRKIINDIENNLSYGHSAAAAQQGLSNGALKDSSSVSTANGGGVVEKSVLERLASAPDGNSTENVEELKRSTRRASSTAGNGVSRILQQLEQLIVSDDWINKEAKDHHAGRQSPNQDFAKKRGHVVSPRLSELGRTLVTSSSLKTYIDLLGTHHRQCIASWLYGSTSQTLSTLFRTPNNNLYCSDHDPTLSNSIKTGIGYAIRLALRDAYGTDYHSKGWRIFAEMGPPVVYISPALHIDLTAYLSTEFFIGDIVVLKKSDGDLADIEGRIDHVAFEKQLDDDVAAGKKPLIVIGVVGSPILGQNDIVSRLLEIRKLKTRFWIHVVGQGLAALCLKEPSEMLVHVLSQADSFTAPLALWLGIPAAPVITLHRSVENYKPSYREKLDVLPWWVACQHLTPVRITNIIENAYFLSKVMLRGLSAFPQIEILGVENPTEFANRVYKGVYTPLTVLIFKYIYPDLNEAVKKKNSVPSSPNSPGSATSDDSKSGAVDVTASASSDPPAASINDIEILAEYADSLNSWLSQGLISDCRQLGLQMVDLGGIHGTAFRFCPLESAAVNYTHVDQVHKFIKQLSDALVIIESTVTARKRFKEMITKYPSLALTPVRKWAGVGAVCYVPSIVKETPMIEWNEKQRQQVSHLNLELVHSLRFVDTAFSAGESPEYGVSCVKFGMLSDDKDLTDLIHLVAERGKEIEQSQQYMDSLAEMIRQGIEAANEDLKRENDARLMQEGVMRQIPLMGSLVNWFSPLDKEVQNIRGRSFDLKTGQIQSTEVYYKHRLMNQTSVTSQEPHHTVARISSGSPKQREAQPRKNSSQNGDVGAPRNGKNGGTSGSDGAS